MVDCDRVKIISSRNYKWITFVYRIIENGFNLENIE